jgi:Zn-finger nucleic acid-binding protein
MLCPKCHEPLRTVDRQGVHLDQCERCGGIFLDRGELEQILSAEQRYYGGAPPYLEPGGHQNHPDSQRPRGRYPDSPGPYRGEHRGHYPDSPRPYGHHGRGRRSFLGDLFG